MTTLLLTHDAVLDHATPSGHPERADRIRAVNKVLAQDMFEDLIREEAPRGDMADVARVHPQAYIDRILAAAPQDGDRAVPLDPDTWMSPGSVEAALRCVGAGTRAVDAVMAGEADNAFCAMRPPGHHAETSRVMGFCLFNSAAIAAHHARAAHGLKRVAVIDFDVHHGNGTQDIFWNDHNLLYGSTHQMPLYPGTGAKSETGAGNVFNAPLSPGAGGEVFRDAMESVVLPALDNMAPDLIIISAGFDAHRDDPLGGLELTEQDYAWITGRIMEIADRRCNGRIVSLLEGGYDLRALAMSAAVHVRTLMVG
jgi:acetoin utilization deacetylase AcuC-like enzyme